MYLKSIEVHGFKSFANKIVFDFHNGITGIVGPNGSGKSNVADAVRWVLGEQRARQLRGASMQDVIFSGTENRKPLSYASVAITMDNSDHHLDIDFEEVTVTRRVYRSGESEYLINGAPCRLKDVNELFYDTGIGKEGYSIIGQGQIDQILSGKPEERRELFDEAAGIVKFKRRKSIAVKKLENERENVLRVNDILTEQERQLAPLKEQSEKARIYLNKKEELKALDVNMFLLEAARIEEQLKEANQNCEIAEKEYEETSFAYENIKKEYEELERRNEELDREIEEMREMISQAGVTKGKLEGQINVLKEQIRAASQSEEYYQERKEGLQEKSAEKEAQKEEYEREKAALETSCTEITKRLEQAKERLRQIQEEMAGCNKKIEDGKNEMIELLNQKASVNAKQQRYDTLKEQINIRKASLNKRILERKNEEKELADVLAGYKQEYETVTAGIEQQKGKQEEIRSKRNEQRLQLENTERELEESVMLQHRTASKLESLRNISERYEGYGVSIRKIMEEKSRVPGIHGVVADLIKVEKQYETAVETALGGSIQNIVTEDEATAKRLIAFLKEKRYGRATFLPLTSVGKSYAFSNEKALTEKGVVGLAHTLVHTEEKYVPVMKHLLGRIVVADTIDNAVALARKYRYSLHIVTLEGESLRPGGSISGGAYRNNSNLLGRKREMDELSRSLANIEKEVKEKRTLLEQLRTARSLLKEDLAQVEAKLQEKYLVQNTARVNYEGAKNQIAESEEAYLSLRRESEAMENQLQEIRQNVQNIMTEVEQSQAREQEIEKETLRLETLMKEKAALEESALQEVSEIQLEEAAARQKTEFAIENILRVEEEMAGLKTEADELSSSVTQFQEESVKKQQEIAEIEKTLDSSGDAAFRMEEKLKEALEKKENISGQQKGFFQKREEVSQRITQLDKEIFRLKNQREKLEAEDENRKNYMWEEYELTMHTARELRKEGLDHPAEMKRLISELKEEIRKLGTVNVNAIEDYKNLAERYEFLSTQRDDLIESEKTLMGIIDDLDTGMRRQFTERFGQIQREFDKAFKELFGGGKGTLELIEGEDILECGIQITAQPPGKRLQNMMQLSGGEKALTAISLLFAIQNLKPSPFCLLDEIEAALDDSNVNRFAAYLHKLTKNTQFIIITHRRGTMAAADRLYGITMQEKGVSTLVSVNLIENDLE
ncbi:MAG: chromosome segregation protein SMC [Eubacterium sp.]|nr:chromosome segregation protein SMC [Eubacterium sp.]